MFSLFGVDKFVDSSVGELEKAAGGFGSSAQGSMSFQLPPFGTSLSSQPSNMQMSCMSRASEEVQDEGWFMAANGGVRPGSSRSVCTIPCLPPSMSSANGEMDRGEIPLMVLSDLNGVWYHPLGDGMRYGCQLAGNLPQMPSMVAQSVHVDNIPADLVGS